MQAFAVFLFKIKCNPFFFNKLLQEIFLILFFMNGQFGTVMHQFNCFFELLLFCNVCIV